METLVCLAGDKWTPNDLDRVLAERPPDGEPVETFLVDHWRIEDQVLALADGGANVAITAGVARVLVFHAGVEPDTRQCENCGTVVGKPASQGGTLRRLRRLLRG